MHARMTRSHASRAQDDSSTSSKLQAASFDTLCAALKLANSYTRAHISPQSQAAAERGMLACTTSAVRCRRSISGPQPTPHPLGEHGSRHGDCASGCSVPPCSPVLSPSSADASGMLGVTSTASGSR